MEERAETLSPAPVPSAKNPARDKKLAAALKRNMQRRKLAHLAPEVTGSHE